MSLCLILLINLSVLVVLSFASWFGINPTCSGPISLSSRGLILLAKIFARSFKSKFNRDGPVICAFSGIFIWFRDHCDVC